MTVWQFQTNTAGIFTFRNKQQHIKWVINTLSQPVIAVVPRPYQRHIRPYGNVGVLFWWDRVALTNILMHLYEYMSIAICGGICLTTGATFGVQDGREYHVPLPTPFCCSSPLRTSSSSLFLIVGRFAWVASKISPVVILPFSRASSRMSAES